MFDDELLLLELEEVELLQPVALAMPSKSVNPMKSTLIMPMGVQTLCCFSVCSCNVCSHPLNPARFW